jgi:hypothetical protein
MLSKCVQCRFNIRQSDDFCLNCGLKKPTENIQPQIQTNIPLIQISRSYKFRVFLAIFIAFIFLFFVTSFSFLGLFYLRFYLYLIAFVLGISSSLLICYGIESFLIVEKKRLKKSKNNLITKNNVINSRITELNQRQNQIDIVLNRIGGTSSKSLQEAKKKLFSARKIAVEQLSKYKLQKHKIELVRLQNQVLPYITNFYSLDEFKTEDAVIVCEQTIREVGKIRQNLAENFPNKDDYEFGNFMQNLDETSNSCEKLWEALLNKQAVFTLKDVQPLEKADIFSQTNELAHTIETFNIESTLTDFSESFEQLETEYKRLLADNEVSQKLLNYEN